LAGVPPGDVLAWTLIAGVVGVLIDVDHFVAQLLMPGRRANVMKILANPLDYMDSSKVIELLHYPGFGVLRLKYHLFETVLATLAFWHFSLPYAVPVLASLWVHCMMDFAQVLRLPDSR